MKGADFELLHAHLAGDPNAFARLAARHEAWLLVAARRRLGDDHLAKDALQVMLMLAQKAMPLA